MITALLIRWLKFIAAATFSVVFLLFFKLSGLGAYYHFGGIIPGISFVIAIFLIRKPPSNANSGPFFVLPLLIAIAGYTYIYLFNIGLATPIVAIIFSIIGAIVALIYAAAYQEFLDLWHPGLGIAAILGALGILIPFYVFKMLPWTDESQFGSIGLLFIAFSWQVITGFSFCLESHNDEADSEYFSNLVKKLGKK